MQTPFQADQTIVLRDSDSKEQATYRIAGVCGYGASCIVYDAIKEDKRKVRIKEYFPAVPSCVRNEKLDVTPEENTEGFYHGLERFRRSYDLQQELRRDGRLTNSIIPAEAYCHGYGTEYIVTTDMTGASIDQRPAETLEELLCIALSITKVIGIYHEKGILHLDIKPANIFRIPETDEHVMLFDFDSVAKMTELQQGEGIVSYSPKWAAPEQKHGTRASLCPATDFYAVGAIVFAGLFHREITSLDRGRFSRWNFDEADHRFVENLNPAIFEKLTEFFHKTLAVNIKKRYSSSKELEESIEALLKLADPQRKYIMSHIPNPNGCFVGREKELEEIHERLCSNPVLCIYGMGGIGKSELAKQYAMKYKQVYGSIIYAPYINHIESVFSDDELFPIYHFSRQEKEDFPAYYKRKMRKFKALIDAGDKDILIIIDNLTDFEDEGLVELLSLGCRVVITSRINGSDYGYSTMKLDCISDMFSVRRIFHAYYGKPVSGEIGKAIDAIIELVDKHTLAVELLAKQMQASRISPDRMLERLRKYGLSDAGKEKIILNRNNETRKDSAYELIRSILDISGLPENERYILKNLTFFPYSGVHTKCFATWCGLESYDDVNELAVKGWINLDKVTDHIAVHPIVSAVVKGQTASDTAWLEPLLRNSLKEYNGNDYDEGYGNEVTRNISYIARQLMDGAYGSVEAAYYLKDASMALQRIGSFGSSKRALEKALDIFEKILDGQNVAVAEVCCKLGRLLIINAPKEAEEYLQKACAISEEQKYDEKFIEVMKLLSVLHPFKASHYYRKAIEHCHDQRALAEIYKLWGDHYKWAHHFRKARKCYKAAMEYLVACGGDAFDCLDLLVSQYGGFRFCKLNKKDFKDVEQLLKDLIDFAEKGYKEGEYLFLLNSYLLACQFYLSDKKCWGFAEEYGMKALDLCLQIEEDERDFTMLAGLLSYMGVLYKKQGRLEEAGKMISRSLQYLGQNDQALILAYFRLASIHLRKKNLRLSRENFAKALGRYKYIFK